MRRTVLILGIGAIGILLGVGLSFAVDAIAGSDLSDPVPLGITSVAATHRTAESPGPLHTSAPGPAVDDTGGEHAGSSKGVPSGVPSASGGSDGGSSASGSDYGDSDDAHSGRSSDSSREGEDD